MDHSSCLTNFEHLEKTADDEVRQLCLSLGFKELSAGLPSRGEPDVLLNDLKGFVNSRLDETFPPLPSSMAWGFLQEFRAGEDLWAKHFKKLLRFPRDAKRQKSADHSSPAQGSDPVKKDLSPQDLVDEALASGRIDEEVEIIKILGTKAEQDDVLRVISGKATSQGSPRSNVPRDKSGYPVTTPSASDPARAIKLEDAGDTRQWLNEPADRNQISYGSIIVNQRSISHKAARPLDPIENCEILGPESELDDYMPERELSSDSFDETGSNKRRTPTPPLSSLNAIKRVHWPRQHSGTPPPNPARNKLATPSASPHSLQSDPKLPVLFPNLKPRTSTTCTILRRGKRRIPDTDVSPPPSPKRQNVASTDDEFWRERTPPRRIRSDLKVTPLTPPSPAKQAQAMKPVRGIVARPITLQFSLGNVALGVISKGLEQCSTFAAFNEEAALATGYLSRARSKVEPDLLVADIDGGERSLPFGWKHKRSYEKLCDAIGQAARNGQGALNVKIYCLRKGKDNLRMPPFFA